jgi:hypothetical protein
MAKLLANAALLFWPFVSVLFFKYRPAPIAITLTILCGLLLLPAELSIKVPMIPAIDKNSMPTIGAVLGCLVVGYTKKKANHARAGFGVAEALAFAYVVSPLFTSALNNDSIVEGSTVIPGVDSYDGISAVLSRLIGFLPFLLGRHFFRRTSDIVDVLKFLVIAASFYSLPMLFEIRMSPQLSNWIYGYFPSSFSTESRYGGFRPVVFFENGLALSFFLMTAVLASFALWRAGVKIAKLPAPALSGYLVVVLLLCKSMGAFVYVLVMGPIIAWARPRFCVTAALILVGSAIIYPLLRAEGIFPDKLLVNIASEVNEERAGSLQTRFEQEQQLLDRSSERPIFGWGRFGRSRVYDQYGKDISLTDGLWIITLGQFGIVGFVALFGVLSLPVFRAASSLKFAGSGKERFFLTILASIVALTVIEQLPNASLNAWDWLLAGSLLGVAESVGSERTRQRSKKPEISLMGAATDRRLMADRRSNVSSENADKV